MEIKLEWSEPGLLRVVWPEEITAEDVARFTERHDAMVELVTRYVIYHESRGVPGLNAALRRQLTTWVERSGTMHAKRCLGACFVTESPVARAIVTGVWWMISTPYPPLRPRTAHRCTPLGTRTPRRRAGLIACSFDVLEALLDPARH
jgi:hypothetical protein